jgi:hypothetical protein
MGELLFPSGASAVLQVSTKRLNYAMVVSLHGKGVGAK